MQGLLYEQSLMYVKIFPKRYCGSLMVKLLQSHKISKLNNQFLSNTLQIIRKCVSFEDSQMILVPYFAISYGFNFGKNAKAFQSIVEQSLHTYIYSIQRTSRVYLCGFCSLKVTILPQCLCCRGLYLFFHCSILSDIRVIRP